MKSGFWPYTVNTYDLFLLVKKNPRITGHAIARTFHVNEKTAEKWWKAATEKRILLLPEIRKRAFTNFKEFFYYVNVKDPHNLYEELVNHVHDIKGHILHFSVQTGFCNFQIVSTREIDPEGDVVLSGVRSDYVISTPRRCTFEESLAAMRERLSSPEEVKPSPLVYHANAYEEWDEYDEKIYGELSENLRKPFTTVLEKTGATRDKILNWMKKRDQFGHTIVMYFPEGLPSYQPTMYCVDTSSDSVLIDLFSLLPVPAVFYRVGGKVMMKVYLQNNSLEGKYISYKVLSELRKRELVRDYTNSIVQYGYRT